MLYMVIGRFRRGIALEGIPSLSAPETLGLTHIGSWVEATLGRSFHVIECENVAALQQWAARWRHRVELEVVPILSARDTVLALEPLLG